VGVVTLRDVVEDDIQAFYRHQSDPVSTQMAQVAQRDEAAYFARWTRLLADEQVVAKTILVDGVLAGHVMSFNRDGMRELGYWLGSEFWGQGIAGSAVRQYLTLEIQRPLFAIVAEHNIASRRILSRFGFQEAGRHGDALRLQLLGAVGGPRVATRRPPPV
jgi:RimJ/RimL family protein N-acetyltransferase